jgi:hypothetical protein
MVSVSHLLHSNVRIVEILVNLRLMVRGAEGENIQHKRRSNSIQLPSFSNQELTDLVTLSYSMKFDLYNYSYKGLMFGIGPSGTILQKVDNHMRPEQRMQEDRACLCGLIDV